MKVVDLLKFGVRLVGELERSGIWKPTDEKRARCGVDSVWSKARASQKEVLKPRDQRTRN